MLGREGAHECHLHESCGCKRGMRASKIYHPNLHSAHYFGLLTWTGPTRLMRLALRFASPGCGTLRWQQMHCRLRFQVAVCGRIQFIQISEVLLFGGKGAGGCAEQSAKCSGHFAIWLHLIDPDRVKPECHEDSRLHWESNTLCSPEACLSRNCGCVQFSILQGGTGNQHRSYLSFQKHGQTAPAENRCQMQRCGLQLGWLRWSGHQPDAAESPAQCN